MNDEAGVSREKVDLAKLSFDHPIPARVRANGWALDPGMLEPGDLILVSSKKPNIVGRVIRYHQGKLFEPEHSKWQHAAVSGGRFELCEATATGVKASEYWGYMTGEYDIKVRRLLNADAEVRSKLAYYAATNVRSAYGYLTALNMRGVLGNADAWQRPLIKTKGVICSQLYFESCMRVGYLLTNIPPENVSPAHLSMTPLMEDVPLKWAKV
ncbi:MAG: hypothetical protein AAF141_14455 [Pseudomonadota bacterium]